MSFQNVELQSPYSIRLDWSPEKRKREVSNGCVMVPYSKGNVLKSGTILCLSTTSKWVWWILLTVFNMLEVTLMHWRTWYIATQHSSLPKDKPADSQPSPCSPCLSNSQYNLDDSKLSTMSPLSPASQSLH